MMEQGTRPGAHSVAEAFLVRDKVTPTTLLLSVDVDAEGPGRWDSCVPRLSRLPHEIHMVPAEEVVLLPQSKVA